MTSAPAAAARTLNRAQILEMGRQGSPWQFLPLACRALRQVPHDAGLRFLCAANFARLGLVTPAREQLDLVGPASGAPEIAQLSSALDSLPADRVPSDLRIATCLDNVETLALRGLDLSRPFAEWALTADETECFRARDGNVIRRARGERDGAAWLHMGDLCGAAVAFVNDRIAGKPEAAHRPFTVEGCDPPWLLRELCRALPRGKDGYWPAIQLVQADMREFLDGLSLAPLHSDLLSPRLRVFLGADASAELAAELAAREGVISIGPLLRPPGLRTKASPDLDTVLRRAETAQSDRVRELEARVGSVYGAATPAGWRSRFDRSITGGLRVLIPTCRFSTFIRHASEDLATALRSLGHEARVLAEPDDSSRLSSLAFHRAFAEFTPDLVVLINYTRANMNSRAGADAHPVIPPNVPYVCWLQDAMPHQFEPGLGSKCGPLDFLAGHLHEELFSKFGFAQAAALSAPVVASAAKFHATPVAPDLARRFACDVAFVSHHSESPEAMHERLKRESARDPRIPRVYDAMLPTIRRLAAHPERQSISWALREAAASALREHLGADPDARTLALVHKCYALPLADRLVRHETLRWAAELCEARAWKLHVYGRGWESNPPFAKYAKGELAHDEELRAAYASAGVHLHASSAVQLHQRVLECFLSGGVALSRLMHETVRPLRQRALLRAARSEVPHIPSPCGTVRGLAVADHPELMRWTSTMQRLGLIEPGNRGQPIDGVMYLYPKDAADEPPTCDTADLLGDLAETSFTSRDTLGELIERCLESPSLRAATSRSVAARIHERYTSTAFASRLVRFVQSRLGVA